MKHIKSTLAISTAIVGAALAGSGGFSTEAGAKELKLGTFMSPKHYLNRVAFPNLGKEIAAATGGETTFKIFAGGQLGKGPVQQVKRVVSNVMDVGFGIQGNTSTIFPATMIAGLPGIGTDAGVITKKTWGIYHKYLKQEYTKFKILGIWHNTPPVLMSRRKLIKTIADIKGLKVRSLDGLNTGQANAWGASGMSVPITGVYDALDKGVVDVAYVAINALFTPWRFGEISKNVTTGLQSPSSIFWLAMNSKVWDGLPAKSKAAIDGLTGEGFSIRTAKGWAVPDFKAIERISKPGSKIKYHTLSAGEAAKFDAATKKFVDASIAKAAKKGVPAREIYNILTK